MSFSIKATKIENPAKVIITITGLSYMTNTQVFLYATVGQARYFVTTVNSKALDGVSLVDYYPLLSIPVVYEIEIDGKKIGEAQVSFDSDFGWLRSSIDPEKGVKVSTRPTPECALILFDSFREYGFKTQGRSTQILGASQTLWLSSGFIEPEKTVFSLFVKNEAQIRKVADFFKTAQLLCLQSLPDWGLNQPVVHFPSTVKIDVTRTLNIGAGVVFSSEITPVKPPAKVFLIALTVGWVDQTSASKLCTIAEAEINAESYMIAEIDANPRLLFGAIDA